MSQPGASDVHVDSTEWKGKKPKKTALAKRSLEPLDDERSKTPFSYDGNVLGSLREDQVPRFFGALTDSDKLPATSVKLDELTAMQNRVDTAKVKAIAEKGAEGGKLPVVVKINGRLWIADGHHRLTAAWLNGDEEAEVRFKDLEPETNVMKTEFATDAQVFKVDESLGLVFGWAIVCKADGNEYFDSQGDHIPEDAMLKAAADFMANSRMAKEMHAGSEKGSVVFAWPMTADIAKAMGIETNQTGLMIAMKPDSPAMLAKFKSGEYSGFSIGGRRIKDREVTDA
ncbi:XkdF-like putative serine protease domain-containing protein [Chelativorans sp. AA-79]|uniref:XkdF-like putative serine protease domain-containing protein n=1 Tax=Chelativorans sp. AA-79 TaxID=3028735 RepID=UPI0023FA3CC0|nr:XkdF-like putative serine protease domain-containing protein [Chelativorans sp. AA-79]WEX10288.1 XkdF-like putative serine protease domain-containing protein [Chelativorans sp. AA-79]